MIARAAPRKTTAMIIMKKIIHGQQACPQAAATIYTQT